jgi:hypothetical protein
VPQPSTYADVEVRILERQDKGYPVEITVDSQQEFPRGYLDPAPLPWTPSADLHADGVRLFQWLFADEPLRNAWAEVRGKAPQRRLRLRIDASAPELHAIPWESVREAMELGSAPPLAASVATPFSRYLAGQWRPGSPILKRPIKVLVVIANPENLSRFNLQAVESQKEWELLQQATAGLEVELTLLPPPCTLQALEAELKKGYHVLHFVGHGQFSERLAQAALLLANGENQVDLVKEGDFAEMLARQMAAPTTHADDNLRLVFLAACQSATRSPANAFRGLAPRLIQAGAPAVLAMQDLAPVEMTRTFAQTFYRQLLQHGQVDLASNEARSAVISAQLPGAAVPVLFMRLRNGLLFGQRGQILGDQADSFWNTLLDNIANGECTPFLGPGVTTDLLPTPSELAHSLALANNYPFPDQGNLPRVAQFLGAIDNRRLLREVQRLAVEGFQRRLGLKPDAQNSRQRLTDVVAAANWSERSRQLFENEVHHQLAELDLPLYITTNPDNFLALALEGAKKRAVRRVVVDWRTSLSQGASRPHFDLNPPASKKEPVVLHLFGGFANDQELLATVLTEDDHLDYMARLARDYEYLLPTSVNSALASTTLLFLGYRLDDLALKVILRGLLTHLDLERWGMLHVAVQIDSPSADAARENEVIRHFERYFSKSKIDVYWGSTKQFVADLHTRWQEHRHVGS